MKNNKYKLVFFDLDGTIVNSLPDITNSVNYMLEKSGLSFIDKKYIVKFIGEGSRNLIKKCFKYFNIELNEKKNNEALNIYLEHYKNNYLNETNVYEGVIETFKKLNTTNILVTNKSNPVTEQLIEKIGLTKYFVKIITPETYGLKKPDPYIIYNSLTELGFSANDALLVGDSRIDLATARNSKINSCILTYGYSERNDIIGADYIIDNFAEILDIVKN